TTSDDIRIAIGDGRSSVSMATSAKGAHDEKLFAEIDRLLRKAKLRLKDVGGLVAASGPGSFTGIRVGMTFVSVLAEATGVPAAGVSLMEAEGERALAAGAAATMVVYPSARDELFVQLFV